MKILLLSPWFPSPAFGGALIRVFETLRHLSRRHRVTLLAPVSQAPKPHHLNVITDLGVEVVTVRVPETHPAVLGRLGRGLMSGRSLIQGLHYDADMARELRRLTSQESYDIIHVEHSFMAPYVAWVNADNPTKKVLSMHNIESLRFRREMHVAAWGLRRVALAADHFLFGAWEEEAVRRFDAVSTVSRLERDWVREHAPTAEVDVVPNGVSLDYFRPAERTAESRSVVFSGLMNYPPNVDAVVWFCNAILPAITQRHPAIRFSIVGDKPTRTVRALARHPGVDVIGRVPDVRPYFANADALVVPVRSGAGTRLKILEAMSMRRPVVTTRLGAEGLAVSPGVNVLVGDSPREFADHVLTLLASPRLGDDLGREGRRLVEDAYDWPLCFRTLDALYERVVPSPVVRDVGRWEAVAR